MVNEDISEDMKILNEIIEENNSFLMRYARGNVKSISKECISMIEKRNKAILRIIAVLEDLNNNKITKNDAREKFRIANSKK